MKNNTSGSMREMIVIAFPMVVSHACDTVMIFTDRVFLARLGSLHMTAAMAGGMSSFMLMSFFLGLTGYSTALVAQFFGARQKNKCAVVTIQSLLISVLAYPLVLLCRPLVLWIFQNSGIDPQQVAYQTVYFNIIIFSVLISLARSSLSGFFCGIGRTRIVMIASIISMAANIILNYILIFGKYGLPALGIQGAAIGTIIGSLIGVLVLFVSYLSKKYAFEFQTDSSFAFDKDIMRKLLHFGYPSGIELFLNFTAFTCMMFLFHAEGAVAATATTIMINWDMVSFVPLLGIEIGVTSLVGRYMGAGQPHIAHRSTLSGLKLGSMYSAVIFIFFMFFPQQLVSFFKPEDVSVIYRQAVPIAVSMLRIACLYVFVETVIVALVGALRGAGDTFWAMSLTVGLHVFIVIVQFLCLRIYGMSIEKTWLLLVMSFLAGTFLIAWRYSSGQWKRLKVVSATGDIVQTDGFHEG